MKIAQLAGGISILSVLLALVYLAVIIICVVLFIRLAIRGIKALDIYIYKNNNAFYQGQQNPYNPSHQYPNQNPPPSDSNNL